MKRNSPLSVLLLALFAGTTCPITSAAESDPRPASDPRLAWWSFQPLKNPPPPPVRNADWPRNPVDHFILAALESKGLQPRAKADRQTLLRRLHLDLLGLPPTPEDAKAFETHQGSPDVAWKQAVHVGLNRPQFGERWARYWLDVARFAESSGFEHDYDRPAAYHFRDFVIRAFNADMPYDQFVRWQLAGDEFAPDNPEALRATGFLGAGVFPTQITANEVERTRYDAMDDMLATTGTAMLGLTVGCARCHDHKFDPISSREYYRMLSTFTTTTRSELEIDLQPEIYQKEKAAFDTAHAPLADALRAYEARELPARFELWLAQGAPARGPFLTSPAVKPAAIATNTPFLPNTNTVAAALNAWARVREGADRARPLGLSERFALLQAWRPSDPVWTKLANAVEAHQRTEPKPKLTKILTCTEGYPPVRMHTQGADFFPETHYLHRGSTDEKRGVATQGFLQVLTRAEDPERHWTWAPPAGARFSGRRRALAHWITDTEHGAGHLLARVIVNRVWQHHFGIGLVDTPNDFGLQGSRPSHPELLDWLATELIRQHWRLKPIHELILLSATYQTASVKPSDTTRVSASSPSPEPADFASFQPRRLTAEAIRDSLLFVSGLLDPTPFGPGTLDSSSRRRSIYFTIKRSRLIPAMQAFDAPEPLVSQATRPSTTVAPQALLLLNSPEVRSWAAQFARRFAPHADVPTEPAIHRAYALALNRKPTFTEKLAATEFVESQAAAYRSIPETSEQSRTLAFTDLAQVILNLNEFVYVE